MERALEHLARADEMAPDILPSKCFALGQIYQRIADCDEASAEEASAKALHCLLRGAKMSEAEFAQSGGADVRINFVEFLVAIAEHYMTPPACDMPEAEERCKEALERALSVDSQSVSALTAMGTYLKIVGLGGGGLDKATEVGLEAYRCLAELIARSQAEEKMLMEHLQKGEDLTDSQGDQQAIKLPTPEVMSKTGQLLLDLNLFEQAVGILEHVVREEDGNPEIWFTLCFAYIQLGRRGEAEMAVKEFQTTAADDEYFRSQVQELQKMIGCLAESDEDSE